MPTLGSALRCSNAKRSSGSGNQDAEVTGRAKAKGGRRPRLERLVPKITVLLVFCGRVLKVPSSGNRIVEIR